MNKLEQLKKKLAALQKQGLTLCDAADAEGRDMTAEEATLFGEIERDIGEVKGEIAAAEVSAERRRSMGGVAVASALGVSALLGGGAALANQVHDLDPAMTGGFADIGEFATAVHGAVSAGQMGGIIDPRLQAVAGAHQGAGDAGEGYMLPPQYRDQVWELVNSFDEFGPLIDEEPTGRREVKLTSDETTPWGTAGIQSYWRSEGSKMDPSKMDLEGRSVPLHELYTLALASDELLEDAPRLNNRLSKKAAEAIAWKKNLAIVDGTGVGQPLGWTKSKALLTVPKETGQAAGTITAKNVIAMYARLYMQPNSKAFWLVNQDTLPQLMTMTIGDRPIWMPPTGLTEGPGGTLLGLPVRFSEFAETLGAKGDIQLISPKGYYGVRRASGVKFASSIHLFFDYNIQAFRWVFRYGGQPHLSKPVTPAKSSSTRSHFITLGERA
jgi:HK97 family phage major capsid protein